MIRKLLKKLFGAKDKKAGEAKAAAWLKVITERVPGRFIELNSQAFKAGRMAVLA